MGQEEMVTPGEVLGKATEVEAGKGTYVTKHSGFVYASLTSLLCTVSPPPESPDQGFRSWAAYKILKTE
ncbi:hypothetical protein Patl1_23097 [Pistacia atlantica]|uniref:Uncharacterized protein n=1 Tax=Pistacia atlantica TaxID=434234 RepID=A0ACC0ZYI4_9ROSI|nr:hypothetical protein Patl1_23097 [Pistacia atlantica]